MLCHSPERVPRRAIKWGTASRLTAVDASLAVLLERISMLEVNGNA